MTDYITHYTSEEGGEWIAYPAGYDDLAERAIGSFLPLQSRRYLDRFRVANVIMKGPGKAHIVLHSFKTDTGREWDTFNGWRQSDALAKLKLGMPREVA